MALKRSTKQLQHTFGNLKSSIRFMQNVGSDKITRKGVADRIRKNYRGQPPSSKKAYRKSVASGNLRFI